MMTGSAGRGDAVVLVPWLMYETYGDREALAENWTRVVLFCACDLATFMTGSTLLADAGETA